MLARIVVILAILVGAGFYWWPKSNEVVLTPPPELTGDLHHDDVRHLGWLLRNHWSWLEMRQEEGLDLDQLENQVLEFVAQDPSKNQFFLGVRRFLSGIRDGHASFRLEGATFELSKKWPFTLVEVEEGLMVDGISPVTFSARILRPGDLVLEIDGQDINDVIAEREKLEFASTDGARRRRAIQNLTKWTNKDFMNLRVHRRGRPEPENIRVESALKTDPVPMRSWRHFPKAYKEIDEKTSYLCLENFSPNSPEFIGANSSRRKEILSGHYQEYRDTFTKLATKKNLILDLRSNSGGTDLLAQAIALHLLEPGFRYYRLASKRGADWQEVSWTTIDDVGFGTPRFKGKVFCLIDEWVFSAADNLACCLRDCHPNIVFLGQPAGGGSGAPRKFTLPSTGAQVSFCTMQVRAPNGEYIEGRGVQPNILIRPTVDDLMAKRDVVLESAIELAK